MIELVMSIGGAIIMILIAIVGYFLKQIHISLQELTGQVGTILIDISVGKSETNNIKKSCQEHRAIITGKLDRHSRCITDIKHRVTKLEK